MDEFSHLAVDGVVDLLIRTVNILYTPVVDELFYKEGSQIQTDQVRAGNEISDWRDLIVNVKLIGTGELLKAPGDLFLNGVFAVCLDELVLYDLHGNRITQRFRDIP